MATITEDYCSREIYRLLRDKGFDGEIHTTFDKKGYTQASITLQMAMKWLREVHKISIEITSNGYLIDDDVDWECDIKAGHRLYFKHITGEKSFESVAEKAIKYCLEYLI